MPLVLRLFNPLLQIKESLLLRPQKAGTPRLGRLAIPFRLHGFSDGAQEGADGLLGEAQLRGDLALDSPFDEA